MRQRQAGFINRIFGLLLAIILGISGVFSYSLQANAKESDDVSKDTVEREDAGGAAQDLKTVRIGYYASRNFQDGAGNGESKGGYSYEYIQKVAAYTGWRYEYVYGTWEELYKELISGDIDLMAGIAYTDERAQEVLYPEHEMLNETYYIYTDKESSDIRCGEISTYAGKKIGIIDSDKRMLAVFNKWIEKTQVDVEVASYADFEQCTSDFNDRKIDAFVSADNIISGYYGVVPIEKIGKEPYYLCVTKHREDILEELNMALSLIEEQDALDFDAMRNKYSAETTVSVFLSRQERDWMDAHSEVHVGYVDDYLPYSDMTDDGVADGLISQIVPDLFEALPSNYSPEIVYHGYVSQTAMLEGLRNGDVDFVFPVNQEQWYAEQNGYQQSSAVIAAPVMLVYTGIFDDKTETRLAVNKNNLLQFCYTLENYPTAMIVLCDSIEDCISAVKKGEANATVMSSLRGEYYINLDKKLNKLALTSDQKFCFGVAFGNNALLQILNHGITILGDSYGFGHIYQYLGDIHSYTAMDFVKDNIGVFIVLIIVAFACVFGFFIYREYKQQKLAEREAEQMQLLENALENAKRAATARMIFLRSMSHDIRTPMNAVLGFANLAMNAGEDVDKIREYLSKIVSSGNHLLGIVNDVLELSRIESGQTRLDEQPNSIPEVVEEVDVIIRQRAQERQQHLTVDISQVQDTYVYCDRLRIKEILVNLLDNAVKFTPEGGEISLTVLQQPSSSEIIGNYEIRVKDNGCGMSQEFLQKIFIPFERASDSTVSNIKGTGLGMPIVKRFVDMMGGTIDILSEENKGTEIIVRLSHRLAKIVPGQSEKVISEQTEERGDSKNRTEQKQKQTAQTQFAGKRLLMAEDNELNREIAVTILEDAGFKVDTAENGAVALKKLQSAGEGYYAAVLMDIRMPVMDGYTATKAIRNLEDAALAGIPVIAISANAFEEDKVASFEAGMNGHLAKPIDAKNLLKMLEEMLGTDKN